MQDNNTSSPPWSQLTNGSDKWQFHSGRLVHKQYVHQQDDASASSPMQKFLVQRFLAAQKGSRAVKRALNQVLQGLGADQWGVNIGAGQTRLHPRMINVDVFQGDEIDVVNVGTDLPFRSDSVDCVVSQEVLEHVNRPRIYVAEAFRVLKPGGLFYCQVPFIIGYHPGPTDFWRFTKEGLRDLFAVEPWEIVELAPTLGHGSGFYRILVEFLAVNASLISNALYKPTKGLCCVLFYPLQWLDLLSGASPELDRIAGGYYCIARKPGNPNA